MIARRALPLLLLGCAPSGVKSDVQQGASTSAPDSIVLERSICYGTCPAYRLRLSRAGEIRFESRNPGDEGRTAVDTVTAATLPTLVSRARSIGFFDSPARIQGDSILCPTVRTDAPTVVITVFTKDETRRVQDYLGCVDRVEHRVAPQLERLRSFESEIDSALGSSRWVRPASRR